MFISLGSRWEAAEAHVLALAADSASATAPSPRMLDRLSPEAAIDLANTWSMSSDENRVNRPDLHYRNETAPRIDMMRGHVVSFAPYPFLAIYWQQEIDVESTDEVGGP